jgi:hypothetical protein
MSDDESQKGSDAELDDEDKEKKEVVILGPKPDPQMERRKIE